MNYRSRCFKGSLWVASRGLTICDSDWSEILSAMEKSGIVNRLHNLPAVIDQENCPRAELDRVLKQLTTRVS